MGYVVATPLVALAGCAAGIGVARTVARPFGPGAGRGPMTALDVLWVGLGAGVGAPLRYLLDRAVQSRHRRRFPWGTFGVNVRG
ncbi:fluoride efflux transporter FluC [Pseudonocardia nigra]|uniref:fluoride efflux transporter FluC n=1 Tax=Pseudonocardia nigra TaxID=1921578 RepID=UPI003555E248